eukprot:94705-Pelagomonas_calceolata.AAC.5
MTGAVEGSLGAFWRTCRCRWHGPDKTKHEHRPENLGVKTIKSVKRKETRDQRWRQLEEKGHSSTRKPAPMSYDAVMSGL